MIQDKKLRPLFHALAGSAISNRHKTKCSQAGHVLAGDATLSSTMMGLDAQPGHLPT